jgi:hypothetical protein
MRKAPETDDRLGVPHLSDQDRLQPQETQGYDPLYKLPFSTRTAQGPTFAEDFTIALRNRGFSNAVIGFDGLVAEREHGAIGVVPPSKIKKHQMLENVHVTLDEMHRRAVDSFKKLSPKRQGFKELFKQRKQYAEDILALRKQRIEEAHALFEPQKKRQE